MRKSVILNKNIEIELTDNLREKVVLYNDIVKSVVSAKVYNNLILYPHFDSIKIASIGSSRYLVLKLKNSITVSCKLPQSLNIQSCESKAANIKALYLKSTDQNMDLARLTKTLPAMETLAKVLYKAYKMAPISANYELFDKFKGFSGLTKLEIHKFYRTRVKMVGLGFKCYKSKDLSILRLRAGYSHLVTVKVPKCIVSVKPSKSAIVIESVDKTALGNFVNKILRVKPADSYKARGFAPRYRVRPLKVVKKK